MIVVIASSTTSIRHRLGEQRHLLCAKQRLCLLNTLLMRTTTNYVIVSFTHTISLFRELNWDTTENSGNCSCTAVTTSSLNSSLTLLLWRTFFWVRVIALLSLQAPVAAPDSLVFGVLWLGWFVCVVSTSFYLSCVHVCHFVCPFVWPPPPRPPSAHPWHQVFSPLTCMGRLWVQSSQLDLVSFTIKAQFSKQRHYYIGIYCIPQKP